MLGTSWRFVAVSIFLLSGCGQAQTYAPAERIALDQVPGNAPLPVPTKQPKGTVWAVDGARSISFGMLGQAPLLTLACRVGANRAAALHYTRLDAADPGAEALFALVGGKGIARLPIQAENVTEGWQWAGDLPASDSRLDVFSGPATATLPGAGMIELPASDAVRQLLDSCRREGAAATPDPVTSASAPAQSLPNVPSNPAVSPAAR